MTIGVHGMSQTTEWETPQALFDALNDEFGFETDVCATDANAKCDVYYTPEVDGLKQQWTGVCFMNPPYGRDIREWVEHAWFCAVRGATVVTLLPARTDTNWWQGFVSDAVEIRFIRGRLKFNDGSGRAPFPSAIVVFRPGGPHQPRVTHVSVPRGGGMGA